MSMTGILFDDAFHQGYQLGPYSLLERFQRGGQAAIWSAWDESAGRVVAIKIRLGGSPDQDQAQQEETRVIASLQHPSIMPVYAHGVVNHFAYMVMPYFPLGSVERLLESGPIQPATLIPLAAQIAAVLEHIHAQRVAHRDLKPGNLLLDSTGRVYLTDFGLARPLPESTQQLHTGRGTAPYSSPEQHAMRAISHRTDIYSLGVVLFEMLTGELPWHGDVPLAVRQLDSGEELPDPREVNPDLPADLALALRALTAPEPEDRPASAAEAFSLVASALLPNPDAGAPRSLTLEEALRDAPPVLSDDERLARDARLVMKQGLKTWNPQTEPFTMSLTHFSLLDAVYSQVERYGLAPDEAQQRFLLRGALAFGRGERTWWSQVSDAAARVEVCEQAIAHEVGAARERAIWRLLTEPAIRTGAARLSPATQGRLVELAVEAQDTALFEGLLSLISRSVDQGTGWRTTPLGAAGDQALARLALGGGGERAPQAARAIGQVRSQDAVRLLLEAYPGPQRESVLAALMQIRQAAGSLPRLVPLGLRLRVMIGIAARQLLADGLNLLRAYLACALAAGLSLGFYVYHYYLLPDFLDAARILNAVGSGLLFGLIIGLGLFMARLIAGRLHVLAPAPRLLLAALLGGAILDVGFIGYHVLFLASAPRGWLIGASALWIALGFAGAEWLVRRRLGRAGVCAAMTALAMGLSWSVQLATSATPLLYFEMGQPARMAFLMAIMALSMGLIPHLAGVSEARNTAQGV